MLEVSYNLVSRSEVLCLSCTVKWKGDSRHGVNSLPLVNGYKLIKPLLFSCSRFILLFPKGRFIVSMLNRQAQSNFSRTVLLLSSSESQTRNFVGVCNAD